MTADPKVLRTALYEAEARLNTARKYAEEAQAQQHWPGTLGIRDTEADKALERFYAAMADRDRARRALDEAEREGAAA